MLILVRHAMPALEADAPPDRWQLSDAGRAAAIALAPLLPAGAMLVSSTEPKARQTLEPAGPVATDARFIEIRRRGEPFGGDFRQRRREYVSGTDHPDWEHRIEAIARFDGGIRDWRARAGDRPLVVASHGMVMTIWLAALLDLADPADFWARLQLPDALTVDLDLATITRPVRQAHMIRGESRGA